MIGLVLFIVFAIATLVTGGICVYSSVSANKSPLKVDYKSLLKKEGILIGAFAVCFTMMMISIYWWASIKPTSYELFASIVGGLFFSLTGMVSLNTFLLHYYGKNVPEKLDKWFFRILVISFTACLVFMFVLTDGYADYVKYPLVNGISFKEGFVRPGDGSPNIAFYAICILSGAIYVYLLLDHKLYLEYGKHGIAESTFLVALPAGIIGARIFYVIGEWDVYKGDVAAMFDLHSGGLTIMGGAPTGIVVGVLWFMWRHKGKGYDIFRVVDIIVPTILIAQAVGRWGNFFNLEVYGNLVEESKFAWLPRVVFNNMHYDGNGNYMGANVFVPLFLIEGLVNMLGYFVLGHLCEHLLKGIRKDGDLAFGYIIWYGLTRAIMEPLRDPMYNMGNDGNWSHIWAFIFIGFGVLCIVINHLVRYLIAKKKTNQPVIEQTQQVEEEKKENE